ncbi:MAG: GIY-YIG nuclease family protein [Proteobacteria bacterium]|nr:GIY-YIG nuclease family protein [Pseudomonadota bacterium]
MAVANDSKAWIVYIVRCADESLYTGVTTQLEQRIAKHNAGKGAKYTRSRRPVVVMYSELAVDRSTALRRERAIKRLSTASKRRLVGAAIIEQTP